MVAVSIGSGIDAAKRMLRLGCAPDRPKCSGGYHAKAQDQAQAAELGMGAVSFDQPWARRKKMTVNRIRCSGKMTRCR
jgi:endonuclease YncB( thermonuclease family)